MHDIDPLGKFYLGRPYDLETRTQSPEPLLYDAKDLTTHAICVGMTGSGKTGLCLALLEEAGLEGVPAIAIDPKGDLGNLLLTFPELRPADFRPWIDESQAARDGISPDELAAKTAERWRSGLAEWGQDGQRIARFRQQVDLAIYTPGSSAGLPISVLRSFNAPAAAVLDDAEALRERIGATVSGLLALLGVDADPIRSREHILLAQLLETAWRAGRDLDIAALIHDIQRPPIERVGVMDIETFFPTKDRLDLAMRINNLLASPGFSAWMQGEPLDVGRLFHTSAGRPRISIMSIAHLNDAERMFFVTILLGEVLGWLRAQPGASSLRAILYMDEIFGYFPPTANPPSKQPMLTLLKQARAFGLGVVLATQNPVDLDYKGLSNTGTWLLGRLQTERDKARVLEGLEGASLASGSKFDRGRFEAMLSALGSRVFLMNNVHADAPQVFQTRWCLSYLRGPLARPQIQALMDPYKQAHPAETGPVATPASPAAPAETRAAGASDGRPLVPREANEAFLIPSADVPDDVPLVYRPTLVGAARLHYVDARSSVDYWRTLTLIARLEDENVEAVWDQAAHREEAERQVETRPRLPARFEPLPVVASRAKSYRDWEKALEGHLYREETLALWRAPDLKLYSEVDETKEAFQERALARARERGREELAELRARFAKRHAALDARLQKADERVGRERSQFFGRIFQAVVALGPWLLQMWGRGGPTTQTDRRRAASAATRATDTMRQGSDIGSAQQARERLHRERDELDRQLAAETAVLERAAESVSVVPYTIRLRKRDIEVRKVSLVWVPRPDE